MENLEKKICEILNEGLELNKEAVDKLYLSRKKAVSNIKQNVNHFNRLILNLGKVVSGLITVGAISAFIYGYVQENKHTDTNIDNIVQSIKSFGIDTSIQKINSLE